MADAGDIRHILIVEDDPNTSDMLSTYFSSLGYQVSHAAWGQDALKIATETLPDLIVLDIHLPDIDGYEVCSRLRSQRRTEHTPIIFLTERRERMDRLTGLELGAVDYITKPFDVQELRYRVSNILRRNNLDILLHPVTGLPTAMLVEEQVGRVAQDNDLSLIVIDLRGMPAFSRSYGFVTHDDVLRAVALIMRNTASELLDFEPFVGQLDTYQFVLVAPADTKGKAVRDKLDQRLSEAVSFFYPHRDWENGTLRDGEPLPVVEFEISLLSSEQIPPEGGLVKLRQELAGQQQV